MQQGPHVLSRTARPFSRLSLIPRSRLGRAPGAHPQFLVLPCPRGGLETSSDSSPAKKAPRYRFSSYLCLPDASELRREGHGLAGPPTPTSSPSGAFPPLRSRLLPSTSRFSLAPSPPHPRSSRTPGVLAVPRRDPCHPRLLRGRADSAARRDPSHKSCRPQRDPGARRALPGHTNALFQSRAPKAISWHAKHSRAISGSAWGRAGAGTEGEEKPLLGLVKLSCWAWECSEALLGAALPISPRPAASEPELELELIPNTHTAGNKRDPKPASREGGRALDSKLCSPHARSRSAGILLIKHPAAARRARQQFHEC